MTLEHTTGETVQALNPNQRLWQYTGYGVVDPSSGGCLVSVNTGTLDASDTLSVAAGTVLHNGNRVDVSSSNIQINSVTSTTGNTSYRFDTLWIDSGGGINKTEGTSVKLTDREMTAGVSGFDIVTPVMPLPSTTPATVIGVVVVSETDTSITASNLQDRRVPAETAFNRGGIHSPENTGVISYGFYEGEGAPLYVRDGMVIQMADDTAGDGNPGYAATCHYTTQGGKRIATTSADLVHTHWGVYTADTDLTAPGDNQPEKRFNVGGGSPEVEMDFYTTTFFNIDGSEPTVRVKSDLGNDQQITFREVDRGTGSGSTTGNILYDNGRSSMRHQNYTAATANPDYLEAHGDSDELRFDNTWTTTSVVWESDTTANRPASPVVGQRFFDTSLGQPIWYDGTNWVDAQGTTV